MVLQTDDSIEKPPLSERERVSKAAGVVGFYTLLSRILGLVRDMVVARFFGAGMAADAFFVAFRIPNLLRRLFAEGSLTIAFIPVFTEYLHQKSRKDAFELARAVLTLLAMVLAAVTVLGILLAPWVVRVQAFGFGGSGPVRAHRALTRITFLIFLCQPRRFLHGRPQLLEAFRRTCGGTHLFEREESLPRLSSHPISPSVVGLAGGPHRGFSRSFFSSRG
jgi:hypothetical protein